MSMVIYLDTLLQCYVTLKSSAPPPPQIRLRADLQQIENKSYLFTPRPAGQEPQHLLSLLLVSGRALVIVGCGFLLCLLPV